MRKLVNFSLLTSLTKYNPVSPVPVRLGNAGPSLSVRLEGTQENSAAVYQNRRGGKAPHGVRGVGRWRGLEVAIRHVLNVAGLARTFYITAGK